MQAAWKVSNAMPKAITYTIRFGIGRRAKKTTIGFGWCGRYPYRQLRPENNLETYWGKLMKQLKALSNFLQTPIEELLIRCGAADTIIYEMRAGDEPREGTGIWQWPDDVERASFVLTGAGADAKPVRILKSRMLKRAAPRKPSNQQR